MIICLLLAGALQTMAQADSAVKRKPAAVRHAPAAGHKVKPDSAHTVAQHLADS